MTSLRSTARRSARAVRREELSSVAISASNFFSLSPGVESWEAAPVRCVEMRRCGDWFAARLATRGCPAMHWRTESERADATTRTNLTAEPDCNMSERIVRATLTPDSHMSAYEKRTVKQVCACAYLNHQPRQRCGRRTCTDLVTLRRDHRSSSYALRCQNGHEQRVEQSRLIGP